MNPDEMRPNITDEDDDFAGEDPEVCQPAESDYGVHRKERNRSANKAPHRKAKAKRLHKLSKISKRKNRK